MEVMTFNVDKDRRNLTDDTQNFDIDFSDSKYSWLAARQYENQMRQVQLNMQHGDGSPLDLTGANVVFEGLLPDGEHRIIDAKHSTILDAVNGQARFDFPAQAFTVSGSYKQAFFRVYRNGMNVASLEFSLEVYADKVISGLIPADYITPFLDQYGKLQDIIDNASGDLKAALQTWVDKFQDAFDGWSGDYTKVQATITALNTQMQTLADKIVADDLFTNQDLQSLLARIITANEILALASLPTGVYMLKMAYTDLPTDKPDFDGLVGYGYLTVMIYANDVGFMKYRDQNGSELVRYKVDGAWQDWKLTNGVRLAFTL